MLGKFSNTIKFVFIIQRTVEFNIKIHAQINLKPILNRNNVVIDHRKNDDFGKTKFSSDLYNLK
jgi:hypothetical protein